MAQTLRLALLAKERKWRASNVEWQHKLAQYEEWLSRAKDRERAAARAAKHRVDPDEVKTETAEWQATFNPNAPLPQFSFAGQHTSYMPSMLEEELKQLARWTSTPPWALFCLRRGIAVHHSGMNKRYRTVVERCARSIIGSCFWSLNYSAAYSAGDSFASCLQQVISCTRHRSE